MSLGTPSSDEPESEQALEERLLDQPGEMDPELLALLAEEESIEAGVPVSGVSAELNEAGAESLEPATPQYVLDTLVGFYQRYFGDNKASFYNALRVTAEILGAELPVTILSERVAINANQLLQQLSVLQLAYQERTNSEKDLPTFGPVAWEPVTVLHCRLIDGHEFIAFNHPSRDPAKP